jgi:hypothetical protein
VAQSLKRRVVDITSATPKMAEPSMMLRIVAPPAGPNLSDADRAEAELRYGVIEPLIRPENYQLLHVQFPTRAALLEHLCAKHQVKRATVYAWLAAWKDRGLPGLVSRDRSDKGVPRKFNAAAIEFLVAAAMPRRGMYGVLSVREIFRAYEEERVYRAAHVGRKMGEFDVSKYARYLDEDERLRESAQLPEVSYRAFCLWFNRIPEVARVLSRDGEEAFRNTQEVISYRDLTAIDPMDYVVMDHRRLDIFCMARHHGGWRLIRPWLTAAIDMRTRKWLAWVVVESPSSDSIAATLKRVFLSHGLPKACYWDNGKDFRCEWLEGREERSREGGRVGELDGTWRGVMGTLGIRVHHAIVKNARAKIIEPNFVRIANFDRTLPEWCGHKPGARPEHYSELVAKHEAWEGGVGQSPFRTIEQVADLYDRAIEDLNERPLEGEGMQKVTPTGRGWMCPNEAWEVLIERVERRTAPPEVLQMCFARRREYTVQHGEIRLTRGAQTYHYRISANPLALMALNGQTVELAYDPMDMGDAAIYHQSRFVGLATCVELRRMGETAFRDDERARRTARREVKRFIEAAHSAVPVASPGERLDRRREVTACRSDVPRVELPVELPAAIIEAEAATRADREFRFDTAAVEALEAVAPPAADEDDGTFNFFQGD